MSVRLSASYLNPTGVLDAALGTSLLQQVRLGLRQNCTAFLVDCAEITGIDTQGLNCLLQAHWSIVQLEAKLSLFNVNQAVLAFLADNGVEQVFEFFPML